MKKIVVRVIVVILILIVVVVGGTWAMIDKLAKSGIEQGGKYALGVDTAAEDVNISLLNGSTRIDQLKIANPEGFKSPHLVLAGLFSLQVQPSSVIGSPVEVSSFVLDGLDVNIELAGGKNNVSVILDHVKQLGGKDAKAGGPSSKEPAADKGPGKKIRVDTLVIRNVVANFHLGSGKPVCVKVPAIELKNLSSDGPDGATIGTLVARIFPAVIAAVVEKGRGDIPGDLSRLLNADLASTANAMGEQAGKMLQQTSGDAAAQLKANADKATEDINKNLGAPLKNLFGAPKK
ncbi:MAG: hypothetical protein LLG01_05020 [Planctomycetaceae bacterium]|nr:hypothetical protein [Planctomycetaceae bacterium]